MIFRLIVAIAVIVLLATLMLTSIKIGRKLGGDKVRAEMNGLDVDTYHRLGNFVRALKAAPATVDDFVVLPEYLQQERDELIKLIGTAPRLVRRQ